MVTAVNKYQEDGDVDKKIRYKLAWNNVEGVCDVGGDVHGWIRTCRWLKFMESTMALVVMDINASRPGGANMDWKQQKRGLESLDPHLLPWLALDDKYYPHGDKVREAIVSRVGIERYASGHASSCHVLVGLP